MNNEENINKLLSERYLLPHEKSWKDLSKRVSKIYPKIESLIESKTFIPSSPTLMNANTNGERMGTYSSCFPMGIDDSIDGIFDALKESALVTKATGGVGFDFSSLRSSKEMVKSFNKTSSGPLPFIRIFSSMLDGVMQGSTRRGAGMAILDIFHPNILDFITEKQDYKKNQCNRLNFSIKVPDWFYEKLEKSPEDIMQVKYVSTGEWHDLLDSKGEKITIKQLWDKIIHHAWLSAEPGIFNSDIAFRQCTVTNVDKRVLSNPCQPGWAKVLTPEGIRTFNDIKIGDKIWSKEGWTTVVNKWSTGIKKVYKYQTSTSIFYGTSNHKIVQSGEKVEVGIAEGIDSISGFYNSDIVIDQQDIIDGLVFGDGSAHKASNNLVMLYIGENDSDYFNSEIKSFIGEKYGAGENTYRVKTKITAEEIPLTFKRKIPNRYFNSPSSVIGFLRGLYSANGSILDCGRITLKATSLKVIEDVQMMLSSIGIKSYFTTNKSSIVKFRNGDYTCKQSYDLNITRDREKFYNLIGFVHEYKMKKLYNCLNIKSKGMDKCTYDIKSIDFISEEEVFDITVDNSSHTYWTQGCDVSNCAEFINIPYSSCNLGSINVSNLVKYGKFSWEEFENAIELATYFLNNIIDQNTYPIKKIEDVTKKIRPIGLGLMGLAHLFYQLKIPYNSQEAVDLTDKLFYTLTMKSLETSIDLAKKNGSYEAFDYDLFMSANDRFFNRKETHGFNLDKIKKDLKEYGARNCANTSEAPNGSISFIADTSSGIEPVFALAYKRKIEKVDKQYDEVFIADPIFEKYLDKNHQKDKDKILEYVSKNKGSCKGCSLLPEDIQKVFTTARELTPGEHLDILAVTAKNIALSASKTINMPKEATEEDVSHAYRIAHSKGVIGVTVYREGSREGILVDLDNSINKNIKKTSSPKRPKELDGEVHHFVIDRRRYYVVVGLMDNDPYEMFAGVNHGDDAEVYIPKEVKEGKIIKLSRGKYLLKTEETEYDLTNGHSDDNVDALNRMISTSLRHGVDISFVVHQIEKTKGPMISFTKALSRTLKKYIPDGTIVHGDECPNCKSTLTRESGCISCKHCGWSKCS